jgi:hypothetical protein
MPNVNPHRVKQIQFCEDQNYYGLTGGFTFFAFDGSRYDVPVGYDETNYCGLSTYCIPGPCGGANALPGRFRGLSVNQQYSGSPPSSVFDLNSWVVYYDPDPCSLT